MSKFKNQVVQKILSHFRINCLNSVKKNKKNYFYCGCIKKFTSLMISVLFVNFLSLLSEFDFESYMPLIINTKKKKSDAFMFFSLVIVSLYDNTWPHVAKMTLQKLTWGMKLCHIHHIILISHPPTTILSSIWYTFLC